MTNLYVHTFIFCAFKIIRGSKWIGVCVVSPIPMWCRWRLESFVLGMTGGGEESLFYFKDCVSKSVILWDDKDLMVFVWILIFIKGK